MEQHSDPIDRASDIEQEERRLLLEARKQEKEQEQEENAHQATDRFGRVICDECNGLMPRGRLQAIPHAVLCVDCQEVEEKTERLFSIKRGDQVYSGGFGGALNY